MLCYIELSSLNKLSWVVGWAGVVRGGRVGVRVVAGAIENKAILASN